MKKTLMILLATLFATLAFSQQKPNTPNNSTMKQPTTQQIKAVYNIPALIGKKIDEVKKMIIAGGASANGIEEPTKAQLNLLDWDWSFKKDGYELQITFYPKTRVVKEFFLATNDPSGRTSDYKKLLKIGNLVETDLKYKVEPFHPLDNKSVYTGILITKK